MSKRNIRTIEAMLAEVTDGNVEHGMAGGTTTLWARRSDGSIVCVTELDGPFGHIGDDGTVEADGYLVGLYEDEEDFLEGAAPWTPLVEVKDPRYSALAVALIGLPEPKARERRFDGPDRTVERTKGQTLTVGQLRRLIDGLPDDMPVNTYDRDMDDYRNIPMATTQDAWIVVLDVAERTDNRAW